MRLNEFGNDDRGVEKAKEMHPEIYKFMEDQVGYMALERQTTVSMMDMSSAHIVSFAIKPSAGTGNAQAGLEQSNIPHERTEMASGPMLTGQFGSIEFRVFTRGPAGNSTQTWEFSIRN